MIGQLRHKVTFVSVMVLCATVIHLTWAALIFSDNGTASIASTPLATLARIAPDPTVLALVLLIAALTAVCAHFVQNRLVGWAMLMPQQLLLMISAVGVIIAIHLGQYADGVTRPPQFIATDHIAVICICFGHMLAVVIYLFRTEVPYVKPGIV